MSHGPDRRHAGPVFVGRADELAVLRAAFQAAVGGSARVVAVEGDLGVGKTALIDRLLAEVSAPVIRVSGVEGEPPAPWGVLEDIAAELSQASQGDRATALDPQAGPPGPTPWLSWAASTRRPTSSSGFWPARPAAAGCRH